MAAPTIATLIQGLDSVFVYAAYSEGLSSIFSSESQAKLLVFTPAGISDEKASVLWGDENFGWNNFTTLLYWVLAVEENQDAQYNF